MNLQEIKAKIRSYRKFKKGWDFGRGDEFTEQTIGKALELVSALSHANFKKIGAFAGDDGEIFVAIYSDLGYYEFAVLEDLKICSRDERDDPFFKDAEFTSIRGVVKFVKIREREAWMRKNTFDTSISNILTQTVAIFAAPASKILQLGGFPSSRRNVAQLHRESPVFMGNDFTKKSPGFQPYTLNFA